jgi:hypothetical protein
MCNCVTELEKKLADTNTALDLAFLINPKTGRTTEKLQIKVKKVDKKARRGPVIIVPTYCPFCGVKQDNGSAG